MDGFALVHFPGEGELPPNFRRPLPPGMLRGGEATEICVVLCETDLPSRSPPRRRRSRSPRRHRRGTPLVVDRILAVGTASQLQRIFAQLRREYDRIWVKPINHMSWEDGATGHIHIRPLQELPLQS